MHKTLFAFLLVSAVLFAQYKVEAGGAPPSEVDAAIAGAMQKQGMKLAGPNGNILEIWLRSSMPSGPKPAEDNVTMPAIPHGSLLGVMKVTAQWADRRGQTVKPGVYTMRFSYFPQNGDHQGVAPQRDFLLLSLAAIDTDLNATPNFDALVASSRKASGTPHPLVFSMWKEEPASFKAGSLEKMGDVDWVYQANIGDTPVSLILAGKAET